MRLAVDPGHGMGNKRPGEFDPGVVAEGIREADVALAWALTLMVTLRLARIPVFLTRSDNTDPAPQSKRAYEAELAQCSHFLSLHCSAGAGNGVETFYRDERDRRWAEMVNGAAMCATGRPSRNIRHGRETAAMNFAGPCAMVKICYLDNLHDREVILQRDVRVAFAQAILARANREEANAL